MRRLWVVVIAGLLFAACGDDGGGGQASPESEAAGPAEFCKALEPLAAVDLGAAPTQDQLEMLEAASAAGPEELRPAFAELIAVTELFLQPDLQLDQLDQFDEETQRQASADLVAAAESCDLEVPLFVYDDSGDGGGDGGDVAAARERYESSDLRTAIERADPTLEGRVHAIGRGNDDITVQIAELTDPDQAEAVCTTIDEYLEEIGYPQATVRIADGADTALATRAAGGGCA